MSDPALNDIVQISIDRQTQAVQRASFGIFLFASEFATSKTTVPFTRYRTYASLSEMVDDGWAISDNPYKAAQALFSQNPRPQVIAIGRKDSGDADWAAALAAIQVESNSWYTFQIDSKLQADWESAAGWAETERKIHFIDASDIAELVFDADFVASNDITITITVNGTDDDVGPVSFNADHDTTMDDLVAALVAAGYPAQLDPSDVDNRTIFIWVGSPVAAVTEEVTGGVSQPDGTVTTFYIPTGDSNEIASVINAAARDRSAVAYHPTPDLYFSAGWNGEALPRDAGSQTWAFKTIAGLTFAEFTSAQRTAALGKEANIYERVAGVNITEFGTVGSGEYIDIIRGIDWLESRLQEEIFSILVNVDKVPYTDAGVQLIEGAVRGVLDEAARQGLLVGESIEVTVPKVADVSSIDKANRLLPDVEFTATLQGAIHKVEVSGVVTV
jgi:hypothetical protein